MDDVLVEGIMTTDLVTVDDDALVATAAQRMLDEGVGSILVTDTDGRLEGLLTTTDFVRLVRENDPEDETPVVECMTTDVLTTAARESMEELTELTKHGYTHIPVTTDDDVVIGIVSTTDLTEVLSNR